jgi:TatD DNase family protein
MSEWIDTHAHIYAKEFDADREDMLQRSAQNSVAKVFMPNVDHTSIDSMMEVESRWPNCFAMIGLHPCSVKKDFERELYLVEEWLSKRKFAAVGEIGTDLYWDKTFWDQQVEAFKIQVNWSRKFNLPVVIHCRESMDETIALVEDLQDGKLRGIFHCFTGSASQAERIIKLNFHLGIGGVSTFKKGGLDTVLPDIAVDRIVLETDSPYLAPVPIIAQRVAEIKKMSPDELKRQTTENALKIFSL